MADVRLRVLLIRKDFKLHLTAFTFTLGLRVLLIRKDFKQEWQVNEKQYSLRVLLIRKDFKHWIRANEHWVCLRVLLIRKDFKPKQYAGPQGIRLRVLLIRKDFKLIFYSNSSIGSLRVLLIRKDFKPPGQKYSVNVGLRVLLIRKDFKLSSVHVWLSHVWESWEGWVQQTAWVYDGIQRKKDVAYLSQLKKEYGLNWEDVRSTWKNTHCWILTSFPKRTLFKMKCFVCIAEEGGENILKVYRVYCEEKSHML